MSPFHFIFRSSRHSQRQIHSHSYSYSATTTTTTTTTTKWVRDRGLDHAVEKEKHLKPIINIKNLIKSEPSKSLPISIITQNRHSLSIPTRPIDFIRRYPSVFEEFRPGGIGIHPHVRLTAGVLDLDSEEQLMYQSQTYKQQVADRLLKLLMLCRANKIPLSLLDTLKWDLGLPQDYERSIVPEFPDYFRIVGVKNSEDSRVLEVVCWNGELATSAIEKKTMKADMGYAKGMPIAFPVQFSGGLEIDKKVKKWIDEWQKLPYISPYENAAHLLPKSDESDKWAVAVLHEFLHILIPKKTETDIILGFGEYLAIRSRFKRALLTHPGIFYISSKIDTHTVVLKEGYKRGSLVESHPLMSMRNQYIHLMHSVKEDSNKIVSVPGGSGSAQKVKQQSGGSEGKSEGEEDDEEEEEVSLSDAEMEDEDENEKDYQKSFASGRGRRRREKDLNGEGHIRKTREKVSPRVSRRRGNQDKYDVGASTREVSYAETGDEDENEKGYRKGVASNRGRRGEKHLNGERHIRKPERVRSDGKYSGRTSERFSRRTSRRTENKDDHNVGASWREKSNGFKSSSQRSLAGA
ncbi:hypothetical protein FEM48_Zijuj06G0170500 [Ziziphus jujuba var. spinosa]|uniref:PORR domain-containing protein n=1 Tax=Ziziphus jujuba var. spinosa TaxID=714518 RepID=A0A978VAI5_ZIZJJ|nr:protein WHAT'S THIS FACTOR 9, mitochondrial [Ziziphus jujuba var. spinosa]KAH7524920.1 hypothetical protein FEM48_Zijuj06G0170500 [Ziziphus jujuba var. spinosa]